MSNFRQLDLFDNQSTLSGPLEASPQLSIVPGPLSDEQLVAAIPDARLADARLLAAEAGKRRLAAAVPALVTLCNRFVGFGANAAVPEQAAALEALGDIGGPEASRAVVRLIARRIVQGPTLVVATTAAWRLRAILPIDIALDLLRHPNPEVRAATCACVRAAPEICSTLMAMLGDPDGDVSVAAACALGRMGRAEALAQLKRCLTDRPSVRVVEALTGVADDEAIVLLERAGRTRRELAPAIVAALEDIDNARAESAASRLKRPASERT